MVNLDFDGQVISPVLYSIRNFPERNAFCINEQFYTYRTFGEWIARIRHAVRERTYESPNVGLVANDDLETYASIFALWLEGKSYVPLHPNQPLERCRDIITQMGMDLVLDSSAVSRYPESLVIATSSLGCECVENACMEEYSDNLPAYILFTSGSTGKPKGVQITRGNVAAFMKAFWEIGYRMTEEDRCLQCFDLTFDLSVMSYLAPLVKGACVYTVPHNQIKYNYIYGLLEDHRLTFALMVPSTIRYLRPYFGEIHLPDMRYSLFCGETLPLDVTAEWGGCLPHAFIDNVYGPTEDTIFCSCYRYNREGENKAVNGILSIGKSMSSGKMIVADAEGRELPVGQQGELCLAGQQLTPGYWKNPEKNREMFFTSEEGTRYYRTGDLCVMDDAGDFLYYGRLDFQAKIQGYRVELGEIEFHVREYLKKVNVAAVAFTNASGNTEIALFVESEKMPEEELRAYMRCKMPSYMIPSRIVFVPQFPLNANGKTDRNRLKAML